MRAKCLHFLELGLHQSGRSLTLGDGLKLNFQKTKIMASRPFTSWQIDGETMEIVAYFIFGRAQKSLQMVTAVMKLKDAYSLEEKL